jgi:hypothetical protein
MDARCALAFAGYAATALRAATGFLNVAQLIAEAAGHLPWRRITSSSSARISRQINVYVNRYF